MTLAAMPDDPVRQSGEAPGRRIRKRAVFKAAVLVAIAGTTAYSAVELLRRSTSSSGVSPSAPSAAASHERAHPDAAQRATSPTVRLSAAPADVPSGARYVFIGGGPVPESTEVSLEQDLALARRVLPAPGVALFAGGPESLSVRELDPRLEKGSLLTRLGDLFQPRGGRKSRYRKSTEPARAASLPEVERVLTSLLSRPGDPLTVYVAAHGEKGAERRSNYVALWGDGALTVEHLARIHDGARRAMRVVSATCFSGGFAELAFDGADASRGPTSAHRCGLFASTWDREASGCDPNPDRRAQESYSLHVLSALGGMDRHGNSLDSAALDLDGDGKVSLFEAHTRARIASRSIDVPTTTSERLLRVVQRVHGAPAVDLLPEEVAVQEALSKRLGLATAAEVETRAAALDAELQHLDDEVAHAEEEVDVHYRSLRAELLGRWPVLDDPYHPDFASTLAEHRGAIVAVLDDSNQGREFERAQKRLRLLDDRFFDRLVAEAQVLRLLRTHQTLALAGGLRARGGADFEAYGRLLDCERGAP